MKEQRQAARLIPVPTSMAQLPGNMDSLNGKQLKEIATNMHMLYEDLFRTLQNNDAIYRGTIKRPPEFAKGS